MIADYRTSVESHRPSLLSWLGQWAMLLAIAIFVSEVNGQSSNREPQNRQPSAEQGSGLTEGSSDAGESRKPAQDQPLSKFDGQTAFKFLKKVCDIGPRVSGSQGMKLQQDLIQKHFEDLGAGVYPQEFKVRHPNNGSIVQLKNMLIRWHPDRDKRLLICCHYDTRPFADRDPVNPRGTFIGANDGGSGVGLLCELGNHMTELDGNIGVDFVFFDAEEFVFVNRRDQMFVGSTHFAQEFRAKRVKANYIAGVLVDMVADKNLQIYYEKNSIKKAPIVTREIWGIAGRLGIKEFVPKSRHTIRDDHLPLNQIARIPVCDIIDFDFPVSGNSYWHTQKDIAKNCSADSLEKVGTVVLTWIREVQHNKRWQ